MTTQDERITAAGEALDLAITNWKELQQKPELLRFLLDVPELLGVGTCLPLSQQVSSQPESVPAG